MTLPEAKPLTNPTEQLEQYIRDIWQEHCERRENDFPLMSSAEFSLAMSWWEQQIPLRVVLRAFQDTVKSGSSLFYYRAQVQEAYRMWRKALGPYAMADIEGRIA